MKILHLCLSCFYIDNYSYQENMLPKYHKKMGHSVSIIASLITFDKNGKGTYLQNPASYINEYGIPVHRIDYRSFLKPMQKLFRRYSNTYELIEENQPDVIFIHGCQFADIKQVIKYVKKNPNVKIYVDNHADFSNSGSNWLSRNILHKVIWRYYANLIEPYVTKFYGVLPARVQFLINTYKLPTNKVDLLVMGADDEKVFEANNRNISKEIRQRFNIKDTDFLIMTGGKIDHNKPQTLLLMEAIKNMDRKNVKLIVFGTVTLEYKEKLESLICDKVKFIGWIDSKETYKYFNSADLAVFPGKHSVFWEQVVGLGKPCVFKYMEGFTHIDLNGNCKFLNEDSVEEIIKVLTEIIDNKDIFEEMEIIAKSRGINEFSYNQISQKSIMDFQN